MSANGRGTNGGHRSTRRAVSEHEDEKQGGDQRPASDGQKHDRRESCGSHQLEGELLARLEEGTVRRCRIGPTTRVRTWAPRQPARRRRPTSRATKGRSHSSRNAGARARRGREYGHQTARRRSSSRATDAPAALPTQRVGLERVRSRAALDFLLERGSARRRPARHVSEIRERCSERALIGAGRPLGRLQSPARHERDELPAPSRPRACPHAAHRRGGHS
jgi:hypothetical protein